MAIDKSQITNNKSGTPERTGCAILRNPLEESDSLRLRIISHAWSIKFFENVKRIIHTLTHSIKESALLQKTFSSP